VTSFMQQHGGKVTIMLTALQLANCKAQGKSITECATELALDAAKGAALVYVFTPQGALIVAAVGGAISIYEAGVEAMKQWEDKKDRDAAYKLRADQTQTNVEKLRHQLEAMRRRIENELKSQNADVRAACEALKDPAQSIETASKSAQDHRKALSDLIAKLKDASKACDEAAEKAPAKKVEIEAMLPKAEDYERRVTRGIEWAKTKAADCRTKEEATKIREMYSNCKGLAAGLKQYAAKAQAINKELKDLSATPEVVRGALAAAKSMLEKIAAEAQAATGIEQTAQKDLQRADTLNRTLTEKSESLLREIDGLRFGFPDDLLKANENEFESLRNLAKGYQKTSCDLHGLRMKIEIGATMAQFHDEAAGRVSSSADIDFSACSEISPVDEAVETIEGAANTALLTVAEAEDLPQKATECLSKVSEKKAFDPNKKYDVVGISPAWTQMKCQISQNTYAMLPRIDTSRTSCIVRQDGFDTTLFGNQAIQILSKEGYIRWDNCGYVTTDKYKQFSPGQAAGSPTKSGPKKSQVECLYMFCPMCKGASLLGVAMSGSECDLCSKANYENIQRCMNE